MKNSMIFIFFFFIIQNIASAHRIEFEHFDVDHLDESSEVCMKESEDVDFNVRRLNKNDSKNNLEKFKASREKLDQCISQVSKKNGEEITASSF